jgi:predicted O-methyltransferase YrrM
MHPTTNDPKGDLQIRMDKLAEQVQAYLSQDDREAALSACKQMLQINDRYNQAHMLMAKIMMPGPNYANLLSRLHRRLRPETYVEIGVATGASMAIAGPDTRCIGIDPCPRVTAKICGRARLYPITSDEFFERYDLFSELGVERLELAFIDGLHLFEQALRDFINLEKYADSQTVLLIHDCYPPTELSAERERVMAYWAGDVWRLIPCLLKYRPDLKVGVVPALPSGVGLVTNLNAASTVLTDNFDEIVAEFAALSYTELDAGRQELLNPMANDWAVVVSHLPG